MISMRGSTNKPNNPLILTLEIEYLIQSVDPVVWNTICILTQSETERDKKRSV